VAEDDLEVSRFETDVLRPDPTRRSQVLRWLEAGLRAVDAETLTSAALEGREGEKAFVLALGKAGPAMARGAARVLDVIGGLVVSDHDEAVPGGMTLMLGNHPIPGPSSLECGEVAIAAVTEVPPSVDLIALISGGGSALCELPRPGVPLSMLATVYQRLLVAGLDIEEMNTVRSHLSAIKSGGLASAAGRAIETLVISDVAGADPSVVSSGPTIPSSDDPDAALSLLEGLGVDVADEVRRAISARREKADTPTVRLLADGQTAARAAAAATGSQAAVRPEWVGGDPQSCLEWLFSVAGTGITVAAGETTPIVAQHGQGGRNTHAALLAASLIAGTDDVFVSFATDGVDGSSHAAGGVVDGTTIARGGDPTAALAGFDSASYLREASDLLVCAPTGTNVADLWILWRGGSSAAALE
jgi:glycerate 2-kinase